MSNEQKQKSNWDLLLVEIVLVAVISGGIFGLMPTALKRARTFHNWTGFGQTKVTRTEKTKEDETIIPSKHSHLTKTLWDYLELSSRLAVPIVIAILGYCFQQRDRKRAEEQAELEKEIAKNNLSEEAREDYLKSMAELLLNKELREKLFPNVNDKFYLFEYLNPVREVAQLKTITILRRFEGDTKRQARIINFLQDAELDRFIFKNANLSAANLSGAELKGANLSGANLSGAELGGANLSGANLSGAELKGANLERADLSGAELKGANLERAYLGQANLEEADLERVKLRKANLEETNLRKANLTNVQNLTSKQIKLACFWEQAIYTKDDKENQNYIENLKKDRSLDPEIPVDFSIWNKWH